MECANSEMWNGDSLSCLVTTAEEVVAEVGAVATPPLAGSRDNVRVGAAGIGAGAERWGPGARLEVRSEGQGGASLSLARGRGAAGGGAARRAASAVLLGVRPAASAIRSGVPGHRAPGVAAAQKQPSGRHSRLPSGAAAAVGICV